LYRVLFTAALIMAAASAAASITSLPENAEARTALADVIFAPVGQAAAARSRAVPQNGTRDSVYFQTAEESGSLYLIFPPPGVRDAATAAAGGFIIKRSLRDGKFVWLKVFVQDDAGSYVRLAPLGADPRRSAMDIYIGGAPFQEGVTIAQPFENLLTAPFAAIMAYSEGLVDWSLILPPVRTPRDASVEKVVAALRARLKSLGDVEDGAMDSAGRFVYIESGAPQKGPGGLNCSGFAKLVVDGFYMPLMGRLTDIAALKQREPEARGNRWSGALEEQRDSYFGLDWTRNLARELEAARTGAPLPDPEFADVQGVERFEYTEDVGYPIENLREVLYVLGRRDPGCIYIGSLSREAADGAPVRQYHHVAVFFPYVDAKGVLRLIVMERNVETSVDSLKTRYPKDSVHLVRISADGDYKLP
jgi:hypothetical protein